MSKQPLPKLHIACYIFVFHLKFWWHNFSTTHFVSCFFSALSTNSKINLCLFLFCSVPVTRLENEQLEQLSLFSSFSVVKRKNRLFSKAVFFLSLRKKWLKKEMKRKHVLTTLLSLTLLQGSTEGSRLLS